MFLTDEEHSTASFETARALTGNLGRYEEETPLHPLYDGTLYLNIK